MDEQVLEESKKDESNKQNFINVHFQSKFVKQKQTYSVNKVSFRPNSNWGEAMTLNRNVEIDNPWMRRDFNS